MSFVWAIALMVLSYAITSLLTPKSKVSAAVPDKLGDFQVPTTDDGTPEAILFGDCWTPDWTVLWYGDLDTKPIHAASGDKKK